MFIECTLEGYNQGGGPGRSVECLVALDDVAMVTPLESREGRKPTLEVRLKSGQILTVQGDMETFVGMAQRAEHFGPKGQKRGGKKAT